MYNEGFGNELSKLRILAGYYSQRKFAQDVGLSSASISRIESGKQKIEPDTLKKMAPFLKVSYEQLMDMAGYIKIPAIKGTTIRMDRDDDGKVNFFVKSEELEFLKLYRSLSEQNKNMVKTVTENAAVSEKTKEEQSAMGE